MTLESKLYDAFPQYAETNNTFFVGENQIKNRNKTFEQHNIKDGDTITIKINN